jgi:DNA-binding PadR family transcriptional regulator
MLTPSSSAAILQFKPSPPEPKPNGKPTFQQAREAWLQRCHGNGQLTHADRAVVTQIFRHFNRQHYEQSGELLAFPKWETMGEAGRLSKASIFRALRKLERLGAVEIKHGRYNHQTKKRARNVYRVPDQGFILRPTKVSNRDRPRFQDETRLFDIDSLIEDSLTKSHSLREASLSKPSSEDFPSLDSPSAPQGPPASAPKGPPPPISARPPSPKPRSDEARWRREEAEAKATLERYRAAAANGEGQ